MTDEESDKTSLVNIANGGIKAMLADLYSKGIHSVLVEGGPTLLQGFLDEKLWDEAIVIKSSNIWVDGIKAPWVGIPSYKEVQQYSDLIKYFKPYK